MITMSVADALLRPSYGYMAGLEWVCCAVKTAYFLAWSAWAFFFTRSFWPEYDNEIRALKPEPDPPSGDPSRLVTEF